MAQWDFGVEVTRLLERTEHGNGPRTMTEIIGAASSVVAASHADPAALRRWLSENAEALVGQQILVTAVHSQQSPGADLPRVLQAWASQAGRVPASAAVEWLKEEHPALLRAWLLTRVEDLIAAEIAKT